jgi:hypothetical protein
LNRPRRDPRRNGNEALPPFEARPQGGFATARSLASARRFAPHLSRDDACERPLLWGSVQPALCSVNASAMATALSMALALLSVS